MCDTDNMNQTSLASEFVRSVRGKRSQAAFSRRLRCKSNVVCSWESGRRWPTASKWLWACERSGRDVQGCLVSFYRGQPAWLSLQSPATPEGVAALLMDLKGSTPLGEVARRSGLSRFAISRYLKGQAEPKLPDFLGLIEALSLRLLDFLAAFVDIETLPSAREPWQKLQAARQAAYDLPWSHAVLRVLETQRYAQGGAHQPGYIARQLGIAEAEERTCLEALVTAGQIDWDGERYRVPTEHVVDTQQDPQAGQRLKSWWAQVARQKLERGLPGRFSYNLFAVSRADYERIEALHLAYFREVRAIVAASSPAQQVALVNLQLVPLTPLGEEGV